MIAAQLCFEGFCLGSVVWNLTHTHGFMSIYMSHSQIQVIG